MPKIFLMLKDSIISETMLDTTLVTVGRSASNDIVVDNPAVSSFHARFVSNNGVCTLEDLNSTNGTYVNEQRVSRIALSNNDSIMVGTHTLLFSDPRLEDDPDATQVAGGPVIEKTVMMPTQAASGGDPATPLAPAPENVSGRMTVIAGPTENRENELVGRLLTIGKAKTAAIRLKGFFAPREAAHIHKGKDGYYLSPANGRKVYVNGTLIEGRTLLAHGDTVEVWKVTMQFHAGV